MHDEKGLKTNPLPHRPINRKCKRNAVANQNLPGFISRNSSDNPFGTKRKALFLSGKHAKTTRLFWETTEIPRNSVKSMMIKTRSLDKISEQTF